MPGMATFTTHRIFLFCACLLFLAPLLTSAVPSRSSLRLPSSSFPSHENVGRPIQSYKRPWTRLRDSIIQHTFGLPKNNNDETREQAGRRPTNAGPPANLLAKYGGDVVLRFNVSSVDEATALSEASKSLILDVWEFTDEWVDIRLAKDVIPSLIGLLPASLHQAYTPLMHDLAQTIYESYPSPMFGSDSSGPSGSQSPSRHAFTPALRTSNEMSDNLFFQNYQPLSVIHPWMRLLKSLFPTHVRLINIGISYEGRDIPALRVGVHPTNSQEPSKPRKTIIVTGGSHAREWISVSSINYIAYTLITSYGKSKSITKLVENFDFVFIPTLNPDGYEYTWKNDRLWRKNRQQTSLRFCRGLDIDRSWNYQWDGETTRGNPCSESYAGEAPFEAVESRRFADWVNNETESGASKIVGYLDLHSYSQQVLYPYSYTCTMSPPSLENLEELAIGLAKAIRLSSGENYGVRSACEGNILAGSKEKEKSHLAIRMESGGGSALDWFYGVHHVRYSYQMKLRDTGSYGFLLPRENIIPTGKEAFEALAYLGRFLLSNKGIEESLEPGEPREPDKKTEEPAEKVVSGWELRRRRR